MMETRIARKASKANDDMGITILDEDVNDDEKWSTVRRLSNEDTVLLRTNRCIVTKSIF